MAKCPNLSNETVREEFNKILARLKGKALPADYVVNPRDYHGGLTQNEQAAYDMAYSLWDDHANTGAIHNFIDGIERVRAATNTSETERARAAATRSDGYHINKQAMNNTGVKDFPDTPITPTTEIPRAVADKLFDGDPPPFVGAAAAAADHFSRRFRALWDMRVLTDMNPHIESLQRVDRLWKAKNRYAESIMLDANDTHNRMHNLSPDQKKRLFDFIDDYMNRRFIPKDELDKGADRLPTQKELTELVKKHGMEKTELAVFSDMAKAFRDFANKTVDVMKEQIDLANLPPKEHAKQLAALEEMRKNWLNKPYFPAMRFGDYTLQIEGPEGNKFYRFETARARDRAWKEANATKKPDEIVTAGKLPMPRSAGPFQGLPHGLLDLMEKRLKLSPEQLAAIQQLKLEVAPIQSFAHRFQKQKLVPGYSRDFARSFSNYFFHGSRYLANIKFMSEIDRAATDLEQSARDFKGLPREADKRRDIANFVRETLDRARDPRGDWAIPRAFAFHMFIGFRAASAFTNLTQTLVSTYPHLSSIAGNFEAMTSMTRQTAKFQNFYKHQTIAQMTSPEMRALNELMHEGVIKGALSSELAGHAQARNLEIGYGPTKAIASVQQFLKYSGMLFELAEQTNRRIAAMSMHDIAMRKPNLKFVRETVNTDPTRFAELLTKGYDEREAGAIMAASRFVDRTQFSYERFYRPAYQRGFGSVALVFRLFQHRMLWNMWAYKDTALKTMLMFGALGGLTAIPFFSDINNFIKAIAYKAFGKDVDLLDMAREFMVDTLHMDGKNMWDDPYVVTNGIAGKGLGIPYLLDYLGEMSGAGKFSPHFDLSRNVAMSDISPVNPYTLLGPGAKQNPARAFAQSVANGFGALGSYTYNVFQAMEDTKHDVWSIRRWERTAPSVVANIAKAYRQYSEGGETTQAGNMLVRMDPHNAPDMAQIIASGFGFSSEEVNQKWGAIMAKMEANNYWAVQQKELLAQYWTALRTRDPQETLRVKKAIDGFNAQVKGTPAFAYAITGEALRKSMQTRARVQQKQEADIPLQKRQVPLFRDIDRLFPGAKVDTQKVR